MTFQNGAKPRVCNLFAGIGRLCRTVWGTASIAEITGGSEQRAGVRPHAEAACWMPDASRRMLEAGCGHANTDASPGLTPGLTIALTEETSGSGWPWVEGSGPGPGRTDDRLIMSQLL